MKKTKNPQHCQLKIAALLAILGLALYALLPQFESFKSSLNTIMAANPSLLAAAVVVFAMSYLAAAATFCLLCFFKLSYRTTLLIQVADGFTNKLVPAGLGAVTTNFLYIKKKAKSNLQAGYIAVLNNLIGFIAHLFVLISLLVINQQLGHQAINLKRPHFSGLILVIAAGSILLTIVLRWRHKPRSTKNSQSLFNVAKISFQRPSRLAAAFCTSILLTFLYATTLFLVVLALDLNVNFLQTFLVFTFSVAALSVVPTPGGIGGVEASLVAAFVAFGVAPGPALSATLAYRLITYWLPIVPGAIALEIAYRNGYIAKPN